jgi:hypothetical protein
MRAPLLEDGRTHLPAVPCLMARPTFQVRPYQRLSVQAPLYFHNDEIQGTGSLWNVSLDGCRMDASLPLCTETVRSGRSEIWERSTRRSPSSSMARGRLSEGIGRERDCVASPVRSDLLTV